jgi:hypothetical protein
MLLLKMVSISLMEQHGLAGKEHRVHLDLTEHQEAPEVLDHQVVQEVLAHQEVREQLARLVRLEVREQLEQVVRQEALVNPEVQVALVVVDHQEHQA